MYENHFPLTDQIVHAHLQCSFLRVACW